MSNIKVNEVDMSKLVSNKIDEKNNFENLNNQSKMSTKCPEINEIIGKREARNIELSNRERDLRRRLEMLECWLPAVTLMRMMTGDAKPNDITSIIDKQAAGMTVSCLCPNSRLSQHNDIRVRKIEEERKKAEKKLNEAKLLLNEKKLAVDEQSKKIDNAKKIKNELEIKMNEFEQKLSKINNLNETQSVQSIGSIGPDELTYLTKLEELVKSEEISKRQLEELEKRQETYMKALEAAGELWKREEYSHEVNGLKNQLDVKSSANQQLADRICQLEDQVENLQSKLTICNDQIKEFNDKESVDIMIGTDKIYKDTESLVTPEIQEASVIYDDSQFHDNKEIDATVSTETRETSAIVEVTERAVQDPVISSFEKKNEETTTENELQFMSLKESGSKIEETISVLPLIYDSSEVQLETRSKITKFDISTQRSSNFVTIEISQLEIWNKNIDIIYNIISKCSTCKTAKPNVVMIEEAINQQLGIEFVRRDDDDETYQIIPDEVKVSESRVEYKIPEVSKEINEEKIIELEKDTLEVSIDISMPIARKLSISEVKLDSNVPEIPDEKLRMIEDGEIIHSEQITLAEMRLNSPDSIGIGNVLMENDDGNRVMSDGLDQVEKKQELDEEIMRIHEIEEKIVGNGNDEDVDDDDKILNQENEQTIKIDNENVVEDNNDEIQMGNNEISNDSEFIEKIPEDKSKFLNVKISSGSCHCTTFKLDDTRNKCPVTSKMSFCICHALRRWPRMTRREYEESKESIRKIPSTHQEKNILPTSKSVLSMTERQSNVISEENVCDPCGCDPCVSVSTTSSEVESNELRKPHIEKKDQGVMAKIYKQKQ